MFLGEYRHTLDEKGRVTVPARLRDGLSPTLYLTRGQDTNLILYTTEAWEDLSRRLDQLPSASNERRIFTRWVFGGATEVSLDKAGRILVPAYLREYAQMDGEVVFVGAREVIELWSAAPYDRESQENGEIIADVFRSVADKGV